MALSATDVDKVLLMSDNGWEIASMVLLTHSITIVRLVIQTTLVFMDLTRAVKHHQLL